MSNGKYILVAVGVLVVLVAAGLGFSSWLQAHDAQLRMGMVIQQKDADIAAREKENAALKDAIAHQPIEQVIKYIPQIVKLPANTPEPVVIEHPRQLTPQDVSRLPDAPSALLPQATLRILEAQAADDIPCRKDLADTNDKLKAATVAAKGGGFWKRLRANSKWFLVGGAAGAVTTVILKH